MDKFLWGLVLMLYLIALVMTMKVDKHQRTLELLIDTNIELIDSLNIERERISDLEYLQEGE